MKLPWWTSDDEPTTIELRRRIFDNKPTTTATTAVNYIHQRWKRWRLWELDDNHSWLRTATRTNFPRQVPDRTLTVMKCEIVNSLLWGALPFYFASLWNSSRPLFIRGCVMPQAYQSVQRALLPRGGMRVRTPLEPDLSFINLSSYGWFNPFSYTHGVLWFGR